MAWGYRCVAVTLAPKSNNPASTRGRLERGSESPAIWSDTAGAPALVQFPGGYIIGIHDRQK
jgi:hypothetical protein